MTLLSLMPISYTPESKVWLRGGELYIRLSEDGLTRSSAKVTITWPNGAVQTFQFAYDSPHWTSESINAVVFRYPDPGGADGWVTVVARYSYTWEEDGVEWGSSDSYTVKFWLGNNPIPQVTFNRTVVGWGGEVGATVEYLAPGTEASLTFEAAGKFIGAAYAEADADWRANPSVQVLNRWPDLYDWTGTGVAKAFPYGFIVAQQSVSVERAYAWATRSPYTGETVTLVETYRGYTIWFLSGPGGYRGKDPYGNECPNGNVTVAGMRTLIDNYLGATYALTVTSNLAVTVTVNGADLPANTSVTLLNGCYEIAAPSPVFVGGVPYVVNYMQTRDGTFEGGDSVGVCLQIGPEIVHIDYMGAEEDVNLEIYRGAQILYDYRPAQEPPLDKCLYAMVAGHGRWFPITEYTIEDVRSWIDEELDTPRNTEITIHADRASILEGESVTFTGALRRTDTGALLAYMPVVLEVNGQQAAVTQTDADGSYSAALLFSAAGAYAVAAVFEGYAELSASAAETRVTAGGEGAGVSPLLVAAGIGAAALLLRKKG